MKSDGSTCAAVGASFCTAFKLDTLSSARMVMADTFTTAQRSRIMSKIRSEGTKPELELRRILSKLGFRYRLNCKNLPGSPDIVVTSQKKAVFLHGCFWHFHRRCGVGHIPSSRRQFWEIKLRKNKLRDRRNKHQLRRLGYSCLVIWECQLRRPGLIERITRFLEES